MTGAIKDPATYRRMSEPLASKAEAESAIEAFFADLRLIRERHHLRDVVAVVQVAYVEGGVEGMDIGTLTVGSKAEALPLLALAYGAERSSYLAMVDRAAGGAS